MDVTINMMNDERVVGTVQNADVRIYFASKETWRNELEPLPDEASAIAVKTDLVYFLDDQETPPYAIVAQSDELELWRCTGCRIDRDRPGVASEGKHGRILRGATFLARSYARNGETISIPGD